MNSSMVDFLFQMRPPSPFINQKKVRKFFAQGGHLTFERADNQNNTKWFAIARDKGFMDAMLYHREGCRGVFNFDNFDRWRSSKRNVIVKYKIEDEIKETTISVPMDVDKKSMMEFIKDEYWMFENVCEWKDAE